MTDQEMQTKITQAVGGALTCMTVMWTAYLDHMRKPTHEEIDAVVLGAALQAWKGIEPVIKEIERQRDTLLSAVKYAYRKHHLGDENIGWDELSEILQCALCEAMGDEGCEKWVEENKP
jgi:hypothetical protein